MRQIYFRVDDRLIHGQVVEGWIKNFRIPLVIIANDEIADNAMQQLIYQSVVPPRTEVMFIGLDELKGGWEELQKYKGAALVLFESVSDLIYCEDILNPDIYINIGCVACRTHSIALSDTVFLDCEEMDKLSDLSKRWDIHIKKLPWEKDAVFGEDMK